MKKYRSRKHIEAARKKARIKITIISVVFLLLLVFIYSLTRNQNFKITEVNVAGADTVSVTEIEKEIYFILDDSRLFLISNNSNLSFPKRLAKERIMGKYPRIADLEIDISGNSLVVNVEEKLPYLLLCKDKEYILDNCEVINDIGEIFSEYNLELQEKFYDLPVLINNYENTEKQYPFSPYEISIWKFIKKIISIYDSLEIGYDHIELMGSDLYVYYDRKSHIKFTTLRNLDEQIKSLEVSVGSIEEVSYDIDEYGYIDLRFEDKVYINREIEEVVEELSE